MYNENITMKMNRFGLCKENKSMRSHCFAEKPPRRFHALLISFNIIELVIAVLKQRLWLFRITALGKFRVT